MKVTVYVNWHNEEVISKKEYEEKIEKEAKEYIESRADFCEWLNEHYEADSIWFMNEEERASLMEEYYEACQTWAEDEVNDYWKPYEVEV